MPKFIITETTRYIIEGDNLEDARYKWHYGLIIGNREDVTEYLDGSTTYTQEGEE